MHLDAAQVLRSTQRFVIEREIGQGGMGVVYQARDLERGARVALKALTETDALNIYRLKNEFRQLADLSHPNLVSLHELCNEGDSWFFTMELVTGVTFDEYVSAEHGPAVDRRQSGEGRVFRQASITSSLRPIGGEFPLPTITCDPGRLRSALRQLVEAVFALHNAGKLHRDIKPSNVLVTPEGRVVVLDFGLVSNTTFVSPEAQDAERTVGGCVFGTPAYMSPEQAAGEAVTTASDWYSVGAMLYEGLTGQLPFDGTVLQILKQKDEREPIPPAELVQGVPDDLDQLCRSLLRRDPAHRPGGGEILRCLTGQSAPHPVFDAQSTVHSRQGELFIGRNRHLDELEAAFEQTQRGAPVTVCVSGVSGMGKSALVRCFANRLIEHQRAIVLRGRCYERETVPYKAFDNIIDALSRYLMRLPADQTREVLPRNIHSLSRLFPVLKRVKAVATARKPLTRANDPRALRNQAFSALKDLLLRLTDYEPLVIQIDDLQWADIDSARLLSHLLGPPDPPPVLLVLTYRSDEAENSPFLRQLLNDPTFESDATDVRELRVEALTSDEARQLTCDLLRDLPTANALFSSAIAKEAEGVPFFITEMVQHLRAHTLRGTLPHSIDAVTLDSVVAERVAGMSAQARRLLEVLSVAGVPVEQGVALEAAGLPPGDRSALLALRAARFIRTRGARQTDTAEPYHDRVRETVAGGLDEDTIRTIHANLAEALHSWNVDDPERLVGHYCAAGNGLRAGESAIQAAHAAASKLAFNRAAELYRKAIELLEEGDPQRRELQRELGGVLSNAGRGVEAAEAYLEAAGIAGEREGRFLRRMAAKQYLRSGRMEEGTELARQIYREVGLTLPSSETNAVIRYVWNRSMRAFSRRSFERGAGATPAAGTGEQLATLEATFRELGVFDLLLGTVLQSHFLRLAEQAGDRERVLHGLAWEAWNLAATRRSPAPATRVLERAATLAQQIGTPYARATAKSARAGCMLFFGQMDQVSAPALEAEQLLRDHCAGSYWEQNVVAIYRFAAIEHVGGFRTVLEEAPERAREAFDRDDLFGSACLTLYVTFASMMDDRPEEALERTRLERARTTGPYNSRHTWVAFRTTHALLYMQQRRQAYEYMERELQQFQASFSARAHFNAITMLYLAARTSLEWAKEIPRAEGDALVARAKRQAKSMLRMPNPLAQALGEIVLAQCAWQAGDEQLARNHLSTCAQGAESHKAPMYSLYARRALGQLEQGDAGDAMVREADHALRAEGIVSPASWSRIWIDLSR